MQIYSLVNSFVLSDAWSYNFLLLTLIWFVDVFSYFNCFINKENDGIKKLKHACYFFNDQFVISKLYRFTLLLKRKKEKKEANVIKAI